MVPCANSTKSSAELSNENFRGAIKQKAIKRKFPSYKLYTFCRGAVKPSSENFREAGVSTSHVGTEPQLQHQQQQQQQQQQQHNKSKQNKTKLIFRNDNSRVSSLLCCSSHYALAWCETKSHKTSAPSGLMLSSLSRTLYNRNRMIERLWSNCSIRRGTSKKWMRHARYLRFPSRVLVGDRQGVAPSSVARACPCLQESSRGECRHSIGSNLQSASSYRWHCVCELTSTNFKPTVHWGPVGDNNCNDQSDSFPTDSTRFFSSRSYPSIWKRAIFYDSIGIAVEGHQSTIYVRLWQIAICIGLLELLAVRLAMSRMSMSAYHLALFKPQEWQHVALLSSTSSDTESSQLRLEQKQRHGRCRHKFQQSWQNCTWEPKCWFFFFLGLSSWISDCYWIQCWFLNTIFDTELSISALKSVVACEDAVGFLSDSGNVGWTVATKSDPLGLESVKEENIGGRRKKKGSDCFYRTILNPVASWTIPTSWNTNLLPFSSRKRRAPLRPNRHSCPSGSALMRRLRSSSSGSAQMRRLPTAGKRTSSSA